MWFYVSERNIHATLRSFWYYELIEFFTENLCHICSILDLSISSEGDVPFILLHNSANLAQMSSYCFSESPNYCNGDFWQRLTDASPIFTEETNKLTLYGIKSWGTIAFFCNSGSEVHVNVDISQYMKWIMEAIRK